MIKDGDQPVKDKINWRWGSGESTMISAFGNPISSTDYALCIYDGSGAMIFEAKILAGPLWRATSSGFKYRNPALTRWGIGRVTMSSRGAELGKASIRLTGSGRALSLGNSGPSGNFPNLGSFPLTVAPDPLRAQLVNSDGECWEGRYQALIRKNEVVNLGLSKFLAIND